MTESLLFSLILKAQPAQGQLRDSEQTTAQPAFAGTAFFLFSGVFLSFFVDLPVGVLAMCSLKFEVALVSCVQSREGCRHCTELRSQLSSGFQ